MCNFFSLVSDPINNKILYFDWELRKKCLSGKLDYKPDSHTSIADYFGYKGKDEDILNKYEYNPLTKKFVIDQINSTNDSKKVEQFCNNLDFKKIVKPLIVKPIVNSLTDIKPQKVNEEDIKNLNKIIQMGDDSVRYSMRHSMRHSVDNSTGNFVWEFVWDSVVGFVWDSSVRDITVGAVWYSVLYSYVASFFDIEYSVNIKPFNELWNRGFVVSFDGITYRLHSGSGIVYETKTNIHGGHHG